MFDQASAGPIDIINQRKIKIVINGRALNPKLLTIRVGWYGQSYLPREVCFQASEAIACYYIHATNLADLKAAEPIERKETSRVLSTFEAMMFRGPYSLKKAVDNKIFTNL